MVPAITDPLVARMPSGMVQNAVQTMADGLQSAVAALPINVQEMLRDPWSVLERVKELVMEVVRDPVGAMKRAASFAISKAMEALPSMVPMVGTLV